MASTNPKPQVQSQGSPATNTTKGAGDKTQLKGVVDSIIDAYTDPLCAGFSLIPGAGPLIGAGCRIAKINAAPAVKALKPGRTTTDKATDCAKQQAANLAPNQDSPSCSSQPGLPLFKPGAGSGETQGNPLNPFINVQYHISLSAISELSTRELQPEIINQGLSCSGVNDEMQQAVRKDGSYTLASTGEVYRNEGANVAFERFQPFSITNQNIAKTLETLEELKKRRDELSANTKILGGLRPTAGTAKPVSGSDFAGPGGVARLPARAALNWRPKSKKTIQKAKLDLAATNDEIARTERALTQLRGQKDAERRANVETVIEDFTDRRYYNIKTLRFTNVMSPTPENPLFSNFIGAEMTLVEPAGFNLHEDIKSIADQLGYKGVHTHRVVWRMDIHFSGYNPDTGAYVPFIPISPKANSETGCKGSIISFYMIITKMSAKTTHMGTEYQIKLAPAGALAMRPEDVFLEACAIERGKTFGDFLKNLSAHLEKQKRDQVKKPGPDPNEDFTLERIYEFIAPIDLLDEPYPEVSGQSTEKDTSENPADGGPFQFEKGSTVLGAVRHVMWDLRKVQGDFLKDGDENAEFKDPRVRYTVRMNTIYDEKNPNINDYRKIRFQYVIEPHLSYKDFTPKGNRQIIKALSLQARLARLKEMIGYGMLLRKYDYLFTSTNTEVINLDLDFTVFYYKTLTQDDTNSALHAAATQNQSANDAVNKDKKVDNLNQKDKTQPNVLGAIQNEALRTRVETNINQTLERLFGFVPSSISQQTAERYLELMSMSLTPAQKTYLSKSANRTDSTDDGGNNLKNLFLKEVDDNLANDLLKIEMDVRGDPIYFYSPYATESLEILEPLNAIRFSNLTPTGGGNPDANKASVFPTTDKVIFLKVQTPEQKDYMNPARKYASSKESIVGGFYIVLKVETTLDGGKFTQRIHATKIANMNYLSENIALFEEQKLTGANNPDDSGVRNND